MRNILTKDKSALGAVLTLCLATLSGGNVTAGKNDEGTRIYVEKPESGLIYVSVLSQQSIETFPSGESVFKIAAMANADGYLEIDLSGLPDGEYAATAFQDRNGNNELDANLVGMPTEPYGFSNNARGMFGPPSFADSAFVIKGGKTANPLEFKLK